MRAKHIARPFYGSSKRIRLYYFLWAITQLSKYFRLSKHSQCFYTNTSFHFFLFFLEDVRCLIGSTNHFKAARVAIHQALEEQERKKALKKELKKAHEEERGEGSCPTDVSTGAKPTNEPQTESV